MRHRLDHRSLDRVRSSQGLRLERFPLEALALVRDRNERRDRLFESHGRRVFRMLDPFDQITQVAALQEPGGEVGEQGRVALAPLGLCGPPPHSRRELARHHRGREIDEKSRPVARLVQRERVHRRQEEPVEDEQRDEGDPDRVRKAPQHRGRKDDDDVQSAETDHRRDRLEHCDRERCRGDQRC